MSSLLEHLDSEHFLTVMSAFLCIKQTDPSAHTGSTSTFIHYLLLVSELGVELVVMFMV